MFASRYAVFIGPGKVPDELRAVLLRRNGNPQPDIAIQVPRILGTFESAADAERVASQLQRLKLGTAVAGPEQPPAESLWSVARELQTFDGRLRVVTTTGEIVLCAFTNVSAVTVVDWRPEEGAADRAVLFTVRDQRPVMLRASTLDSVSRHSVPMDGLRLIHDTLDFAAAHLSPEVKVRTRRLNEADFRSGGELSGDLLPLVLAAVDAVDTSPGELPRPLQGGKPSAPRRPPHFSTIAAACAWGLYLTSLPALILSLGYFTIAALSFGIKAGVTGLALGAWGTRRYMWSRWLAQSNWQTPPIPSFPIHPDEPGIAPRPLELALDAFALVSVCWCAVMGDGLLRTLSLWSVPFVLVAVLTSTVAVYEAWQRE